MNKLDKQSSMREILAKVVKSGAKIKVEDVSPNGDVVFSANLDDLGITRGDLKHPILKTRFFVNFVGELFVRTNADTFISILTGFDQKLYDKIICNCKHTDFGMSVNNAERLAKWQMHISLVQQILIEDFDRVIECMPHNGNLPDVESNGKFHTQTEPEEEEVSSEEDGQ
jgi:hypothetical protein